MGPGNLLMKDLPGLEGVGPWTGKPSWKMWFSVQTDGAGRRLSSELLIIPIKVAL